MPKALSKALATVCTAISTRVVANAEFDSFRLHQKKRMQIVKGSCNSKKISEKGIQSEDCFELNNGVL